MEEKRGSILQKERTYGPPYDGGLSSLQKPEYLAKTISCGQGRQGEDLVFKRSVLGFEKRKVHTN